MNYRFYRLPDDPRTGKGLSFLLVLILTGFILTGSMPRPAAVAALTGQNAPTIGYLAEEGGETESGQDTGQENSLPAQYQISGFPMIYQNPELPMGCEITALTMLLNYEGLPADKLTMAAHYLPVSAPGLYYGEDGRLYGADMNRYFIGSPFDDTGLICGTPAIVTAADSYLQDEGSAPRAVDLTGSTPEELYRRVSQNQPVAVWVTLDMGDRYGTHGWYTEDGDYVEWDANDHCMVLTGYAETTVTMADPMEGEVAYDRARFEAVYASRGSQSVALE